MFSRFNNTIRCYLTVLALLPLSTQAEEPKKRAEHATGLRKSLSQPEKSWRIGMSAAFLGPAQALGNGMRQGIEAYFQLVNETGGVHGKELKLLVVNDSYEPSKTGPNMRNLIDNEGVMCVIGNVGTPTAAVAVPIANEKKIPMFGAFTGAGLLRNDPPDRYVINFRASYAEETARMVDGIVNGLKIPPSEIGFFTQNDAYGDAGWNGAIRALKAIGFHDGEHLPHGRYPRNTTHIEDGLSRLMDPREHVSAVIMVGAYKPCAEFIKKARDLDFNPVFLNVSFVGSEPLVAALGDKGNGVIVTQVVPSPLGDTPAAKLFRENVSPRAQSFVSFEGFLVGKAFVEGLRNAGPTATPEDFIDALESGKPIDLGLNRLHKLSPEEHQLSHEVWPTYVVGGKLVELQDWSDVLAVEERSE